VVFWSPPVLDRRGYHRGELPQLLNSYQLQSAKDGLVFDIKTPVGSGSPLQSYEQKTEANSFVVSGTGFFPGRALTLSWIYAPQQGQGPDNTTDNLTVITDPAGSFDSSNGLPLLASTTGTLGITVTDTATGQKESESSYWHRTGWSA